MTRRDARAAYRRMSAPQEHPDRRASRGTNRAPAGRTGGAGSVAAGANTPAGEADVDVAGPASAARRPRAAASRSWPRGTPRRPWNSHPVGHRAGPLAPADAPDAIRDRAAPARPSAGRRRRVEPSARGPPAPGGPGRSRSIADSPSSRIAACAAAPATPHPRRSATRPARTPRRGRSARGSGRRRSGRRPRSAANVPRPAVLLGRHRLQHHLAPGRGAAAAMACSAATTPPFMSTDPRPCTAPSVDPARPRPSAHSSAPGATTSSGRSGTAGARPAGPGHA